MCAIDELDVFLMMAQVPKLVRMCLLYPFDHATQRASVIGKAKGQAKATPKAKAKANVKGKSNDKASVHQAPQ